MPSGHALNFFSAAAFLGLALRRRALTAALFAIAALVALSRVYLGGTTRAKRSPGRRSAPRSGSSPPGSRGATYRSCSG